jgi:hypothetical protein
MSDKPLASEKISKKLYQEPLLRVYGDVRKLTGLINNMGGITDAMFGASKSS